MKTHVGFVSFDGTLLSGITLNPSVTVKIFLKPSAFKSALDELILIVGISW